MIPYIKPTKSDGSGKLTKPQIAFALSLLICIPIVLIAFIVLIIGLIFY